MHPDLLFPILCVVMQYEALGMTSHYKVFEDMF